MRLHLNLNPQSTIIPFAHQHLLVGCIHKWLGRNEQHGALSLFSFSRLSGVKNTDNGLLAERGVSFFISAYSVDVVKKLINGIQKDPSMFSGLIVSDITIEEDPDLSTKDRFFLGSPILIKRKAGEGVEHILYTDPTSSLYLKETLQTKMNEAGICDEPFDIHFDESFCNAKTMLVNYRGIKNKVSWCPVIITGSPEIKLFAWNVGLGNSTGIGFGAIK